MAVRSTHPHRGATRRLRLHNLGVLLSDLLLRLDLLLGGLGKLLVVLLRRCLGGLLGLRRTPLCSRVFGAALKGVDFGGVDFSASEIFTKSDAADVLHPFTPSIRHDAGGQRLVLFGIQAQAVLRIQLPNLTVHALIHRMLGVSGIAWVMRM